MILQYRLCRFCRRTLTPVLDLGNLALNAFPESPTGHLLVARAPLRLMVCPGCTLVQLGETVNPDLLYRQYWYRSSVNEMMRTELAQVVQDGIQRLPTATSRVCRVLDIGANDGTLLSYYPADWYKVGIDPSTNLQRDLARYADQALHAYFPTPQLIGESFDLITAIACCYDLENPFAFFCGIADLLHVDGYACVQFQDLRQQILSNAFDNICHEHLEYYTLISLQKITAKAGLILVDVERRAINGGSLRVWLRKRSMGRLPDRDLAGMQRVWRMIAEEEFAGYGGLEIQKTLQRFAENVARTKERIWATLQPVIDRGGVIDLYGASTKGNILLQVLGLGPEVIRQAIDRDAAKHERYTITGIPIVNEPAASLHPPAAVWLTPIWQFRSSVLERNQDYLSAGGTILFPLPVPELVQQG